MTLEPRADEQSIALTRDFRLIQKRRGHRYSVDDMLVGHLAATRGGDPATALDLGCGLGSVLLLVAWAFPRARLVGLERLPEHVEYAERNVRLNGCEGRARVVAGDLRDLPLVGSLGTFDLVTGSPPYFLPGTATPCADPARAAAHFELAGGIEAYAQAAAKALAPGGRFVACAPAEPRGRDRDAVRRAGLSLAYHRDVVPREGKPPFLTLLVGVRGPAAETERPPALVLRGADNERTPEHVAIRDWTGVGPR